MSCHEYEWVGNHFICGMHAQYKLTAQIIKSLLHYNVVNRRVQKNPEHTSLFHNDYPDFITKPLYRNDNNCIRVNEPTGIQLAVHHKLRVFGFAKAK